MVTKTQQEIIKQGYRALIDSLGVVDTIRFIQYFTPGKGDYTRERREWLEQIPLEDVLLSMKQHPKSDVDKYDEIIE